MSLNGTPEDFSPAGILLMLASDARTGAVHFSGDAPCSVYLHRGLLYFATAAGTDEALAAALVRPGRLSVDDWDEALTAAGERPVVGEMVAGSAAIDPDLMASIVLSLAYDPLIALFRAGGGDFDFEPDAAHWLGPIRAFEVDVIVSEVRRRVREADEWTDEIPSFAAAVYARPTLPDDRDDVTLTREDWELVTALSAAGTIDALAGEMGRGCYSTARVVHRLSAAGLVEVVPATHGDNVVPLRRADPPWEARSEAESTEPDPWHPAGGVFGGPHPIPGPVGAVEADAADRRALAAILAPPGWELDRPVGTDHPAAGYGGGDGHDVLSGTGLDAGPAPGPVPAPAVSIAEAYAHDGLPPEGDDAPLPAPPPAPTLDDRPPPSVEPSVVEVVPVAVDPDAPVEAAWLEDLYSRYMEEPGTGEGGPKRRPPAPATGGSPPSPERQPARGGPMHRVMAAIREH